MFARYSSNIARSAQVRILHVQKEISSLAITKSALRENMLPYRLNVEAYQDRADY